MLDTGQFFTKIVEVAPESLTASTSISPITKNC